MGCAYDAHAVRCVVVSVTKPWFGSLFHPRLTPRGSGSTRAGAVKLCNEWVIAFTNDLCTSDQISEVWDSLDTNCRATVASSADGIASIP